MSLFVAIVLTALLAFVVPGNASDRGEGQSALEVSKLSGGVTLGDHTYAHLDPSRALTLSDVLAGDPSVRFVRESRREPSFGFTRSAVWLRFDVHNRGVHDQPWLLEIAFPHLDQLDLYEVRADGRTKHWTAGDSLPFAARQIDHPNFVFALDTPPGQSVRYYLRAETTGALRVPLVAWLAPDFVGHESRENLLLWMFYGALAVMTLYNLGIAALLRNVEYLYYACVTSSLGLAIFTLSGQTFQHLTPNSPALANRALAVCFALALLSVQLYSRTVTGRLERAPRTFVLYRYSLPASALLLLLVVVTPPALSIRAAVLGVLFYIPIAFIKLRAVGKQQSPQLRFYVISWYCLVLSLPLTMLAHADVLPPHPLFVWAAHLGCVAHIVCTSLALPARINLMSDHLAGLNAQLSQNVRDLELTLSRAEEANEKARRATLVKSEFMATMSHELRTPLNSIINVPQGLLDDFQTLRAATCSACAARFLLEADETVDAATSCQGCRAVGSLREGVLTRFTGDAARTARFLRKIEKSGKHLLQMVNDVLDSSKMEAGRLELALLPLDVAGLLRDTVDEMSSIAEPRELRIELAATADHGPGLGDPLRLKQVLLNLLANAIKFSEPDSSITVRWQREAEHDLIAVQDQGIGIRPEDQERVFESFEQVHKGDTRKYGGTGLGLAISRKLVRMHGGELWVESQPGHGSTFVFRIPRPAARSQPASLRATGTG